MLFSKRLLFELLQKSVSLKGIRNPSKIQHLDFNLSKKLKKTAVSLLKLNVFRKPQHESNQFQLVKCICDQYFLSYYGNYELRVYVRFGWRKLIFFRKKIFSRKYFSFIRNWSIRKRASLSRWTSFLSLRRPNFLLLNFSVVLHSRSLSCHLCINPSNSSVLISKLRFI